MPGAAWQPDHMPCSWASLLHTPSADIDALMGLKWPCCSQPASTLAFSACVPGLNCNHCNHYESWTAVQDILLMVGPYGDWVKYNLDESVELVTEIDGVSICKCPWSQRPNS